MRRSVSSSHIPVRLFGAASAGSKDAPARKRSTSTGRRLSQQKESSAGKFRGNSLERKSYLKTTPLTRNKSYGYSLATPSSIGSVGSRASRISPAIGLKEKPSIQKLSTNPLWVSQQYKKVQNYISESQVFDLTVINPTNIKPPTIKGFIYLITTLLSQLYPNIKNITQENYKEELVNKLKKLHYPGTMTISTLKTVNTMHCWPQVIGMCGWLIDKIELTRTAIIDYSTVPSEELHKYELPEGPPEMTKEAEQKYKEDFMDVLKVDPNEYHLIKTEYEQLEEKKDKLKISRDNLLQEYEAIKAKRDQLRNDLVTFEANDADELLGLQTETDHFESVLNKLALMKNQLESKTELLMEQKRNQPCSYQEKMELLLKNDDLQKEISLSKERLEYAHNFKHQFDDSINKESLKLESIVTQWNRSLMEVCIKNPNLKKLLLKEFGFHTDEFLVEMREIAKMKQDIEIDLTRKNENREVTFKQKTIDMQNIKKDLENLQNEINKFQLESKQFDQHKEAVDKDIKQALSNWEVLQMNTLLSASDSPEVNQLKQLTEENATLQITRDNKAVELKQFGENAIAFFIELDTQVENNIKELNSIVTGRRQRIEEMILKRIKDAERFMEFLRELREETF